MIWSNDLKLANIPSVNGLVRVFEDIDRAKATPDRIVPVCQQCGRESLEEIVKNTLGYDTVPADDADGFRAGMFLACPLAGGTGVDAEAISRITGIPKWQCARWIIRAQQLEIFSVDGGVFADPWVDPPLMEATINFMLDCMVLSGRLVRTGARGDKNSLYGLPEWSKS